MVEGSLPGSHDEHLGAEEREYEARCACGHPQGVHRHAHYQCGICLCHKYEGS